MIFNCSDLFYIHSECMKDVLDTDIVGTGWMPWFKRWWNDLFLVSYKCDKSRGFYRSANALRADRFRQFRKYKQRIHPLSKFRTFWSFLILHVIVMEKIIFRCTSSFLFDKLPLTMFYFGAFLELIIFADLYVSLKTGYINTETRKVILDSKNSVSNFCATKLFLHVASATPPHWFMFLRYGRNINCGLCKCNRYICILKIISVFNLLRIIETSSCWSLKRFSNESKPGKLSFFRLVRIGIVALVTMIQVYDLGDVVCLLLFMNQGFVAPTSTLGLKAALKYNYEFIVSNYNFLGFDLARMVHSLLHFNFAFSLGVYYLDKMTAFIAFMVAKFFYCWFLIECYKMINTIFYWSEKKIRFRMTSINLLHAYRLPNSVCDQIAECFNYRSTMLNLTENTNGLYRSLPEALKNEIRISCYLNILLRIPLLSDWPVPVVENLAAMLQRKVYLTNDFLAIAKTQSKGLMIIHDGVLAVYSVSYKELGHLIDGDYFGALSLVTDKELGMSYIVAATNCTILFLDKRDFRKYMQDHTDLFYTLKMEIKARNKPLYRI